MTFALCKSTANKMINDYKQIYYHVGTAREGFEYADMGSDERKMNYEGLSIANCSANEPKNVITAPYLAILLSHSSASSLIDTDDPFCTDEPSKMTGQYSSREGWRTCNWCRGSW